MINYFFTQLADQELALADMTEPEADDTLTLALLELEDEASTEPPFDVELLDLLAKRP